MTVRLGDRLQCPGYAVVGVETSGLSPHRHRIVEIAVALCDPDGRVTDFFTTLLNPDGPVGDFQAHGLFDDDVVDAPAFAAIAPWLVGLLRQRVVVAHNARFELGFLEREFQRRRHPSVPPLTMLCTMREAPEHVPEAPRFTLLACCEAAAVPVDSGYGAAAKAMGAARLLSYYITQGAGEARHWQQARTVAASLNWPRRKADPPRVYTRDDAHAARRAREEAEQARRRVAVSYLEKARAYGPPTGVGEGPDSYLAVLDAALEDRVITPEEAADLAELAVSLGISEAQRKDLDRLYVTTLAASMVAAGPVIDREERADLTRVAAQLGIPRIALDDIIAMARDTAADQTAGGTPVPGGSRILARGRALRPGQHVLFHGYLAVTRAELEQRLALARLELASGIHDRVDVLVVADPDESADRTYWARQRGIRVLIEPVFLALLADLERERGSAADAASRIAAAGALAHAGAAAHARTTSGFLLPRPGASGSAPVWTDDPTEDITRDESAPIAAPVPTTIPPPPPPSVTAALSTAPAPPDPTTGTAAPTPPPDGPARRNRQHRGLTPPPTAPAPGGARPVETPSPPPRAAVPVPDATGPSDGRPTDALPPPPPPPHAPGAEPAAGEGIEPPPPSALSHPSDPAAAPAPAEDGSTGPLAPPRPSPPPSAADTGTAGGAPAQAVSPPPTPPGDAPPAAAAPAASDAAQAPDVPPPPAEEPHALIRGQAVTIDRLGTFTGALRVEAAWWGPEAVDADVVVLVLDDDRRVGGDEDLVFYNQPVHPSGAVRLAGKLQDGQPGSDSVDIDVTRLPAGRVRVLVALALDAATGTAFAQVPVAIGIVDPVTRRRLADFRLTGGDETVMILTEVYRRGDSWRLRAVGQGYAEGLAALVTEHGVVVDE
ncbi:TerD family protein [Yinghuangia sp. ASG 101]|uniref:TerD family protein n=1 Tax=Yinghuangia sp. ASG 101 TaxID=2896848 RepID=UPI001E3F6518|nr:TerD family protein [Yinghuangia sp. ASG 101]UGQ13895.1 TerD family protein [Yinghuangia sp. ASG 101]